MSLENSLKNLSLSENESEKPPYKYINVFKNPGKIPINQIHLERSSFQLRNEIPKDFDILEVSAEELTKKFYEKKTDIIPALDKRWVPKCVLYKFEPYQFAMSKEENTSFIANNTLFIESLEYLLKCNFHQFWCTIIFEPSAVLSIRSFILNPIPSYQARYLEDEYAASYKTVFDMFGLVYERLITFRASEIEYMAEDYGYRILLDKKLINLPIVNTIGLLYKQSHLDFVNRLTALYFNDTSQLEFQIKEIEDMINHTLIVFEMIGGHVCGFEEGTVIVPIAVKPRPKVFDLLWIYSTVNYLLNTVALLSILLQFYPPAVEMALSKELPFRIPFTYVNVYRELYELLGDRDELILQKELSDRVFDEINLGRSEFVDLFHVFISYCLGKALEYIDDSKQQEQVVEIYLKLLTTALEDEYFVCDYDQRHNVASQNEMFESCALLDNTRTEFITSCIIKLPRHKKLEQISKLNQHTIEDIFKRFKPAEVVEEQTVSSQIEENVSAPNDKDIEVMIKDIMDMFPHLGDGFVLNCLECYNYKSSDVINAILEENLPPHFYEIPFDTIRIPPEPEPEKPVLAYRGKKPDYDDALSLLNDKTDIKELKNFVLEGVQYSNDHLYDDEYDDRDDDAIPIKVADNPGQEILTHNPNHEDLASDTSYSSEEEFDDSGRRVMNTKMNGVRTQPGGSKGDFCVDPAILREQREAKFRSKRPQPQQQKARVEGKPKGQGQEKDVLKARDKKNVNKSSRANHNRKSGAQWKHSRGMF